MLEMFYDPFVETVYLTIVPLVFSCLFGSIIGTLIFVAGNEIILERRTKTIILVGKIADALVNILRSIPYLILIIWLLPVTSFLTGSVIGTKAAVPALVFSATPFFARMVVIAFTEVDKGVIEASKAMGASTFDIIVKVLIPESKPALISSITVTAINLVSYSAMAGAIGAGGLGFEAYQYGLARRDDVLMFISTIMIVIIVFAIQFVGDVLVKKTDKRRSI